MKKVAIIGAGAAGVCCARHFGGSPDHFQVQVFEKGNAVGGTWIYESKQGHQPRDVRESSLGELERATTTAVHSSMYKNLRYVAFHVNRHL